MQELPRISDRISFLYLEHCILERKDSGLVSIQGQFLTPIPIASVSTLLLGPGTSITHSAVSLIADVGALIVWVGENGSRYYAHGSPLTHSSALLEIQAKLVSNKRSRLDVARRMYMMRFPGEDVSKLTMQQLRGREGVRIRKAYKDCSQCFGVDWHGRQYKTGDPSQSDDVNKALSIANSCLYGAVQSVIVAMGCSPALGFIHTGHERSFVYDIADLYKVEVTFPVAFRSASEGSDNMYHRTRKMVRDSISQSDVLIRATRDIHSLLKSNLYDDSTDSRDELTLWDDIRGNVPSGCSYGDGLDDSRDSF